MSDGPITSKRPVFLTVVCIITFLFCAYGIWQYTGVAFGNRAEQMLEEARVQAKAELEKMDPEAANHPLTRTMMDGQIGVYQDMAQHARPIGILTLVYLAFTGMATWLMWKLKRIGFWVFTAIQVPGFLVPFIWMKPTVVALLMFGFSGLLWAVLIVLFALNLKHMR